RSFRYKEMDQENPYYRYVWNDVTSQLLPDEARANLRATASSALNVVSRDSLRLELFWARNSGAIRSQWWAGAPGQSWGDHGPSDVVAAGATIPGASVTTVARTPDNLDVFWVAPNGSVMTQWWVAAADGGWGEHGPAFPIAPAGSARPGAPIAAVARTADNLDVFWVRPDGAVASQWWAAALGAGWGDHGPFNIAPPGSAEEGSAITVVARMPDHLDVFWVTRDGAIGSNWWTAAPGTSWADHGSFRIAPAGSARPGSALAALGRTRMVHDHAAECCRVSGWHHRNGPHAQQPGCLLGGSGRIGRHPMVACGSGTQLGRPQPVRDRTAGIGEPRIVDHGGRTAGIAFGRLLGSSRRRDWHAVVGCRTGSGLEPSAVRGDTPGRRACSA